MDPPGGMGLGDLIGCTVTAHFHESDDSGDVSDSKSEHSVDQCLVTSVDDAYYDPNTGEYSDSVHCLFDAGSDDPTAQDIPAEWICDPDQIGQDTPCGKLEFEDLLSGDCEAMRMLTQGMDGGMDYGAMDGAMDGEGMGEGAGDGTADDGGMMSGGADPLAIAGAGDGSGSGSVVRRPSRGKPMATTLLGTARTSPKKVKPPQQKKSPSAAHHQ